MINGKFFTGLTDKMMTRHGTGPNRQQSHLYWPDESQSPSVQESSHRESVLASRRRQSLNKPSTSQLNNVATDDVVPRDLFKKQMKSKIEFYDHVDTTKDSVRNIPAENNFLDQKRKTLSSKIEFYDYMNEPSVNSAKKMEPVKSVKYENSSKVPEKKISFTENKTEKPKKEHIIAIKSDDISKKSNIPKKNISKSKSVENLTLKTDDDVDLDINKLNKQVQNLKINPTKRVEEKIETLQRSKVKPILKTRRVEVDQEPEEFIYRNGYDYDEVPVRVIKPRVRPEEEYFYENRVVPAYTGRSMRAEIFNEEPLIVRRPISTVDRYYYQPREVIYREPEIPRRRTVKYDLPDEEDIYERSQEKPQLPKSPSPLRKEPESRSKTVQRSHTVRESWNHSDDAPNEARRRAHQHLKSSISFYNDAATVVGTEERKPLSIRDSAVARVGVGLPDI